MIYGKIPPQAKDLEEAVLGVCLSEANAFYRAVEIIGPECFYVESHKLIFEAMVSLNRKSQPIDTLTVAEELKTTENLDNIGGPYVLTKLTKDVVSGAHVEAHANIIRSKFTAREMIRISGETMQAAYENTTDVTDLISNHEKQFTDLTTKTKNNFVASDEALVQAITRIEQLRQNDDHMTGIPTGFMALDRLTHGWQSPDLIILAARPAVGKTAFALQLARHASTCYKKISVGFFSLEMSIQQLTPRNISAESEVWLDSILNGRLDDHQMKTIYSKAIKKLAEAKIFYDDTAALNIYELRAKCRRLKRKYDVGIIFVDYLQLMSGTTEVRKNREQEISEISRGLKQIAKELKVPVVALSQLSRKPEERKGELKMPQLSDLRESGAIEQDADIVMFMYRPEYYDVMNNEHGESTKGETHIRIAKHRNGSLDTIKLRANLSIQKFYDWDNLEDVKEKLTVGSWKSVSTISQNDDNPF